MFVIMPTRSAHAVVRLSLPCKAHGLCGADLSKVSIVVVAGADLRLCDDRRAGVTPRLLTTVLANHTHLASYTRTVSLPE